MLYFLEKVRDYMWGKLNITITPPTEYKVRSLSIRRAYPVLIVIVIILTIFTLGFLYRHYASNYAVVTDELEELKGVRAENRELKEEIYALSEDTRELNEALSQLKEHNKKIRSLINEEDYSSESDQFLEEQEFELKLTSSLSYNHNLLQQGIPVGGRDMQLYYQDPRVLIEQMHNSMSSIKEAIPDRKEKMDELEGSVKEYNAERAATPSIWPLADDGEGYITSEFGWRDDPFSGQQEFHEGLDVGVWYNTPVLSTAYGKVVYAGYNGGYGYKVRIDHGFGYETVYAHLNSIEVERGQEVKRGEVIALSGNTGRSKGPHLHYEVRVNGAPENPLNYIKGK